MSNLLQPEGFKLIDFTIPDKTGIETAVFGATQANRWLLHSISFQLVTDATVATRQPQIVFKNAAGLTFARMAQGQGQAASQTELWSFTIGGPAASGSAPTINCLPLPERLFLQGNEQFEVSIGAGVAGDSWTLIQVRYAIWQTPYNL